MNKELVMYARTTPCAFVTLARRVLDDYGVAYREVFIDQDTEARQRVLDWTGFLAVPTLIAAAEGDDVPSTEPTYLAPGASPRGIDRGPMITEPNINQLLAWLERHGFTSPAEDTASQRV